MEQKIKVYNVDSTQQVNVENAYTLINNDYLLLDNKPTINEAEIIGDKTGHDYLLANLDDIPTALSELSEDSTHRTVTDTEKSTWNGKQDALGFTPENIANKDQALGYCPLDNGKKVPLANLPATILKYIGVWNASTNTPTLTNPDTTKVGNVYIVSVAGTQFGISWKLGDWLIYNENGVPQISPNSDEVVSVNSKVGTVVLDTDDLSDTGKTNKFVTQAEKITWYYKTKTSLDATLEAGARYRLATISGNLSFALPNGADGDKILVSGVCDGTARTVTVTSANVTPNSITLVILLGFDIEYEYHSDTSKWVPNYNNYLVA